ncbi:MAG: FHA domain-containing protein, partial [Leptolyngbyaceae cyanobacterium SU_3_3]|nr:FHA domain-containing protein [Leptolyngbyaceae cyanobacterium SU_3_3]
MLIPAQLTILSSKDRDRPSFKLPQSPFTIGSAADNSLLIEEVSVEPYHAQILWHGDHFSLKLQSPEAQLAINGKPLDSKSHRLRSGDIFQIGTTSLQFSEISRSSEIQPESSLPGTVVSQSDCDRVLQITTSQWTQDFPLQQVSLTLGRHPDCDIVIDLPVISQHHARLAWNGETYTIQDLGSTNGLTYGGEQITEKPLQDGDFLTIEDHITLTYQVIPKVEVIERVETLALRDLQHFTLGRDPRNSTVIDHPIVSRFHAQIDLKGGSWFIEDLHSSNGTYVNGQQILHQHALHPGDTIRIGPYHFVFNFDETLIQKNQSGNLRLDAVHLGKVASSENVLLHDISLSILPQEFVAIVGVSGAGKSTLLDALNGLRPATTGSVLVNEQDLYKQFHLYRTELGYVPQDDIIHRELTVSQALDYAARLRLPADVSPTERRQQVQAVLDDLELNQRQHLKVSALSGGQRKRVSIGVELLTKPSLFFLDEATSGLDPGTETLMMRLLRRLADQGRTVLLITHATKNVMLCDLVVFLAKGGRLAFFGPPQEALAYFKVKDFDEIYLKVEGEQSPEFWEDQYRQSDYYQTYICDRQANLSIPSAKPSKFRLKSVKPRIPTVSSWRQFAILASKKYHDLSQDRAKFG